MQLADLADRLDERLRVEEFAGVDPSANGLQVDGPAGVERAAFAVDAAVETIDRAADWGADVLCVHHGLVWDGIERVTGRHYRRLAPLFEHGIALYAAHLPLDAHSELGNAAGLADLLDLQRRDPFGALDDVHVGVRGTLADPVAPEELRARLHADLDHAGEGVRVLDFGPASIEDVAVVTGSGVDWLEEAASGGADALVTGEGKQAVYHRAREEGVHVFLAGHYATETFGVRSLRGLANDWGLETTFVDCPTGL